MGILDTLTVVESGRPVGYDPTRSRRRKLAAAIDDQLRLIDSERSGTPFRKSVVKRHRDLETDMLVEQQEHRRVARWWWLGDDGQVYVQIRYGSSVIPLAEGKTVFMVPDLDAAEATLEGIKKAVLAGELDLPLAEAAQTLKTRFSSKRPRKGSPATDK